MSVVITLQHWIFRVARFLHNIGHFLIVLYHPRTMLEKGWVWTFKLFVMTQIVIILILGWIWSAEPKSFNVTHLAMLNRKSATDEQMPPGYVFSGTLVKIAETLLHKRGGYLTNDKLLPGLLMDNMPSWERGTLDILRDATINLRNNFGRALSQSVENIHLAEAAPLFNFSPDSWILPATESEYANGIKHLKLFLNDLKNPDSTNAHFFARADNLRQYLEVVEKRLGGLSYRLSKSFRHRHGNVKDHDYAAKLDAEMTPLLEVDNVFFEARGATWALKHIFQAIQIEFKDILETKKANESINQIIHELDDALSPTALPSAFPLVLNGEGYGLFANYSVTLSHHLSRANAATQDLRELLTQG